ncbi:MAG: type I DNA topoisomerase, partial [Patescibacteria group bacterium]
TKRAIAEALKNPRGLNMNLVDAQQARRVLDRLVGYKLSPLLWAKIAKGLSAGRVQSVAVRLIVEREREIKAFKIEEYWSIEALLTTAAKEKLSANLIAIGGKTLDKLEIKNKEQAEKIKLNLKQAAFSVVDVSKKQTTKNPLPPFTTATLQQTANARLGYSAKQTMMLAQTLYEHGLITYMRTDSVNLAEQFVSATRGYIKDSLGAKYLPVNSPSYKSKTKNAQEAHEAIRPTEAAARAEDLPASFDARQKKLYQLIWQRALASQAAPAILDNTAIDIMAAGTQNYSLRANGQTIIFDGYLKIYPQSAKENLLPSVTAKEKLTLAEVIAAQHFTEPPARYSDATLVKAMEKYGIGRPSTYAPTISTIIERNYAERDQNKKLAPTEIALVVNDLLVKHFPEIVGYQFTAEMEENLDDIARGGKEWQKIIGDFYDPFAKNLEKKRKELSKKELTEEKTNEVCEKCGSPMVIKMGRYGKFMACTNYPECKNTKNLNSGDKDRDGTKDSEELKKFAVKYEGQTCPECGSPLVAKISKYGPFMACSNYPKCKFILNTNGTGISCPDCGSGEITRKRSRRGFFYGCSNYPKCKFTLWGKPTGQKCPKCGSLMIESKDEVKCSNKDCKV